MLSFIQFLNNIRPLSPEAQAAIINRLKRRKLRKGQHWLKIGEVCADMAFIDEGLAKVYFDTGQKELCLWYNKENELMLSVASFFAQTPSRIAIQCVEESEFYSISYKDMEYLYEKFPELNWHARKVLQHYYSMSETHVSILLHPPANRYELMNALYPWMVDDTRITDKMLAAYIGVERTTLYRYK